MLAACAACASLLLSWAAPARAADGPRPELGAAWSAYYGGRSLAARSGLEAFLRTPEGRDVTRRRLALDSLLEICVASLAHDCVAQYAPQYADAAAATPTTNDLQRFELSRRAAYYLYTAVLAHGSREDVAAILKRPDWTYEHAYDEELYIRRQVLAANVHLRLGELEAANRSVDKVLSLIASLKPAKDGSTTVVWALSDILETLIRIGDSDRAYGVFRATVGGVGAAAPPLSVDAALYALRAGLVLQDVGRDADSVKFLDVAIDTIDRIELEPQARRNLLISALNAKAAACVALVALDCAHAALARHPFADLYAQAGRAPASFDEVAYLALRAIAAGFGQAADPVAAAALDAPLGFAPDDAERATIAVYQAVGAALAQPPGEARQAALLQAGRRIHALARRPGQAPFGAWYRTSTLHRLLITLALTQADSDPGADGAETAFTLLQLAGRNGQSFDADALTALGQAQDDLQRRTIHQALRLRARRDGLERERLRAVVQAMNTSPLTGKGPEQDFAIRGRFRDYALRIAEAQAGLDKSGVTTSGVNLVTLKQLQGALKPDEAALLVAPTTGATVYMCVRRDSTLRRVAVGNLADNHVDFKLVQAALTAGHAPSETLDAQYPVASAVRLYDRLIRPFQPCLRPGDSVVWLPNLVAAGVPLAALLERAPPKLGQGYDLSQAAWLIREHAITYAGSASAFVAARSAHRPLAAPFDFLGVGDPHLSGLTPAGEDRAKIVMRGVRAGSALAALAPLPETRDELERSARAFTTSRVLLQDAATESGVRQEVAGAYRYLSFATHGLLRDEVDGLAEPALAFTPVSAQDAMDDGLLTASEIADMNLAARFVALSACNTANFDLTQMAQDLPALASAFAVAGVPATLGTLWPVESETGKQVVAATFERLRAGRGASSALAEAQRAFLAAPPSRAYLHPRFWAPFVILGDGEAAAPSALEADALRIRSIETQPEGSGEVLQVTRNGGRVLARFGAASNAAGAILGVTTVSGPSATAWRRAGDGIGPAAFLVELGPSVIVGAHLRPERARMIPVLESLDGKSGAPIGAWRADTIPEPFSILIGGAKLDAERAVFGVVTFVLPNEAGQARPKLYVYEVDATLAPRLLFETQAPSGLSIDGATFTPMGDALLVTYSVRSALPYPKRPGLADEFDLPICGQDPATRVELRDLRTGELKAKVDLRGYIIAAATPLERGKVWLGGSHQEACAEMRATVVELDEHLTVRPVYRDATLGASEVRTLAAVRGGRVFLAASKDNTVAYESPGSNVAATQLEVARLLFGGMAVLLDRKGKPSRPLLLDAGTSVFVTSSDASDPDDILLGGGIGDRPTIFHLAAGRR